MTREEAQKLVESVSKTAKSIMGKDGCHTVIAIAFTEDKTTHVIDLTQPMNAAHGQYESGEDAQGDRTKDLTVEFLRAALKSIEAVGVITIMEAWMTKAKKQELFTVGGDEPGKGRTEWRGVMPRNNPERQEALYLCFEFKISDGPKYEGVKGWTFKRNGKKIVFGKKPFESVENVGGRFSELIK